MFFLTLFSHVFCALILIFTTRVLAVNVGSNYDYPLRNVHEDLSLPQAVTFAHL